MPIERRRFSNASALQRQTFGDLLLHAPDEAIGRLLRIPAGTECVVPLLVGQLLQLRADPSNIVRRDVREERLVAPTIVETDLSVDDAFDEWRLFEHADVVARRTHDTGPAERVAQIARDVPAARALER